MLPYTNIPHTALAPTTNNIVCLPTDDDLRLARRIQRDVAHRGRDVASERGRGGAAPRSGKEGAEGLATTLGRGKRVVHSMQRGLRSGRCRSGAADTQPAPICTMYTHAHACVPLRHVSFTHTAYKHTHTWCFADTCTLRTHARARAQAC